MLEMVAKDVCLNPQNLGPWDISPLVVLCYKHSWHQGKEMIQMGLTWPHGPLKAERFFNSRVEEEFREVLSMWKINSAIAALRMNGHVRRNIGAP